MLEVLSLNPDVFYLIILSLTIMWALMKYHMGQNSRMDQLKSVEESL